jgi:hypothetical protein
MRPREVYPNYHGVGLPRSRPTNPHSIVVFLPPFRPTSWRTTIPRRRFVFPCGDSMEHDDPIVGICPYCNREIVIPPELQGRTSYCPHCGELIKLRTNSTRLDPPGLRLWTIPLAVLGGTTVGGVLAASFGVANGDAIFPPSLIVGFLATVLATEALAAIPFFKRWKRQGRALGCQGCLAGAILVVGIPLSLVLRALVWANCFLLLRIRVGVRVPAWSRAY